ncbi:hypothetical protein BH20ACT15_BH20ACT15_04430 [soil metagenome]
MSEQGMVNAVQQALAREGIADEVIVAGQFSPRGHSGSLFLGNVPGDELGGIGGAASAAVGPVAGMAGNSKDVIAELTGEAGHRRRLAYKDRSGRPRGSLKLSARDSSRRTST